MKYVTSLVVPILLLCPAAVGCHAKRGDDSEAAATIDQLRSELVRAKAELKAAQARLRSGAQKGDAQKAPSAGPPRGVRGIGVSSEKVAARLRDEFRVSFLEKPGDDLSKRQEVADIDRTHVILSGPKEDLSSITITGFFEGEFSKRTLLVLQEVLEVVAPEWPAPDRSRWFAKAAERSDEDTSVATVQEDLEIQVTTARIGGRAIRQVSIKRFVE